MARRNHSVRLLITRIVALVVALVAPFATAYDWLQFNGDPQHSGNNTRETVVHRNNVGRLLLKWQATLPASSDGAPVLLEGVSTPGGTKDVVYVTTTAGHIVALDATNGAQLWSHQNGPGNCRINQIPNPNPSGPVCYTTSSPVIDPNRQYVYSYGLDGYVHKYQVGDGAEILTGGWPQLATLKGFEEKSASALAFATVGPTTYLYVVNGGYPGDNGDYQGHVTAINLNTGTQNVFNILCSNQAVHFVRAPAAPDCVGYARSAIWSRPGVIYDPGTGRLFMATGNGNFNGATNGFNWGDSVIALNPDGTGSNGKPVDSYTPTNQASLEAADADLGSTSPVILPAPANSVVQHLAMQSGKDAKLRLINLANLNGSGAPGPLGGEVATIIDVPQGGVVLTQPAVWRNLADSSTWTFVVNGSGGAGIKLFTDGSGNPFLTSQWTTGTAGGSPLVANNLLYYAGGNALRALDPKSGTVLWSNSRIGGTHWQSPVVANGAAYVLDQAGRLTAFAGAGAGLSVDVHSATGTSSNLNGVLEPGETVQVEPGWRNVTGGSLTLNGTATSITGPAGTSYTIADNAAGYGTIAAGGAANCAVATGNCYRVSIGNPATRPALHWDVTLQETLSNSDTARLVLHVGNSFPDVANSDLMYSYVESLLHHGVTVGYGDGMFYPLDASLRGATLMFVARATVAPNGDGGIPFSGNVSGSSYNCAPGGASLFADVLPTDLWCKQVHALAARGINVSYQCANSALACPSINTTRAGMAVVVAGGAAASDAAVPASGTFSDTGAARSYNCTVGGTSHFPDIATADAFCRHVNYLWARGMVDGFVDGTFKPTLNVTRGQMAKFVTNGFRLSLYQ